MCVPGCEQAVRHALTRRGFFKGAAAAGFAATAIVPEPAFSAPRRFSSVVDLTHTMSPAFPTFFGVPGIELQKQFDFKKDGFNLYWWRIVEHGGTHLDAPIHFSEGGMTADRIAAAQLVVPLVMVDVSAKAASDPDYRLSRADLSAWEKRHGRLPDNCCVAMNSGWAVRATDAAKFTGKDAAGVFHFPGVAPEAAEWMMKERKVARPCRRHAVARPRPVQGLQDAFAVAAVRPLGARKCRQSRQGTGLRRDACRRARQGQGLDRRSGAADGFGLKERAL